MFNRKYFLNKFLVAVGAFALSALFSLGYCAEGSQERRVALVVGNAKYEMGPLNNPTNDSIDMANKLKGYGFEVVYRENLKIRQIGSMLREFKSKLSTGSTALVFYAGHGLQVRGENYFPAVDAEIHSEEDIQNQSINLKQVMDILEEAKTKANIVLLDACRNNPFERKTRSLSRGLASVNAPSGTIIAYSTRPGSVAEDGSGRNGLYTEQLLKVMDSKKPIEQVLKLLVTSVKGASKGRQEPWSEGSFEGDFCFGGCEDENAEKNKLAADISLWESIIGSTTIGDYERYLAAYPSGTFATLAKKTIENLKIAASRPASTQGSDNSSATIARIEREKAELLKQAEEIKKQELARLEREKAEREKVLALSEEKLKLEAANRQKLEAELAKAKQDAETFRKNQSAQESNLPPKKLFVSPSF
jgi:Caspase domain